MIRWLVFALLFFQPLLLFSQTINHRPPLKYIGVLSDDIRFLNEKFPQILHPGVPLSMVDAVLRALTEKDHYASISAQKEREDSPQIVIVAVPLKKVQSVVITGARVFTSAEVTSLLSLGEKDEFRREQAQSQIDNLIKKYSDRGYFRTKVSLEVENQPAGGLLIKVRIEEGPPCAIASISVRTENAMLKKVLERKVARFTGEPLETEMLNQAKTIIVEYLAQNRYLTSRLSDPSTEVNSSQSEAKVIYSIEKPYSYEFFIDGNNSFDDTYLISHFNAERLAGSSLSPRVELENTIKDLYLKQGFARVEVASDEQTFSADFLKRIYFYVKENGKTRIRAFHVEGKTTRNPEFYINLLKDKSSALVRSGFYNQSDLEMAAKGIVEELQDQGFLRSQVISFRPEWHDKTNSIDVTMNIDEGPRTTIQSIEFLGNKAFSKAVLLNQIPVQTNYPLRLADLEETLTKLKTFYRDKGYLEMEILNEDKQVVQYSEDQTLAKIVLDLHEGPQITAANILVEGNSFTKSYVVRNELEFLEGDILTPTRIQNSVFRLQRLGIFSKVDIVVMNSGAIEGARPILIQVAERDPGLLYTGVGLSNENQLTYRGFVGATYRNIKGTSRAVSARADLKYSSSPAINYTFNRTTISYLEPYLIGRRVNGRFTAERNEQIYQIDPTMKIQDTLEGRAYLEYEFQRNSKFIWNLYTISNYRIFDRFPDATGYREVRTLNIASIGPIFEYDKRNDPINPMSGTFTRLDLEYSNPLLGSSQDKNNTINYARTTANFTHYLPLKLRESTAIWVNTVRGGYLTNISSQAGGGVPSVKAFFLGGQNTIRGFNPGGKERVPALGDLQDKGPKGPDGQSLIKDYTDFYVRSDSYFYLYKTELRMPLYGSLWGTLFYDGGAVMVSGYHFSDPYRDSVGGGFRVQTPVGAVTIEVGRKLDPKSYLRESPYGFHFSIGTF